MIKNREGFSMAYVVKVLLLFGYIYPFSLRLIGVPDALHTARIAAIVITFLGVVKSNVYEQFRKSPFYFDYLKIRKIIVFSLAYTLVLSLLFGFGEGTNYSIIAIDNLIFSILPLFAFWILFSDVDEFANVVIGVTFLQSIAILLGTFIPGVSTLFTIALGSDSGYGMDLEILRSSYASGISCSTSAGVTKFTIGLVMCVYKYLSKNKSIYLLLFFFFSVINSMLARTGMLMSIIGLISIFYYFVRGRVSLKKVIPIVCILFIGYDIISSMSEGFFERFKRYEEFMDGGFNKFFEDYFNGKDTVIPPLSINTLIGTSIISGVSGNNIQVLTDGGFIKNYVALGLPFSVYIYVNFFVIANKIRVKYRRSYMFYVLSFYIVYMAFSEFKEYFLLFRGNIGLFFLFVMLFEKKRDQMIPENNIYMRKI